MNSSKPRKQRKFRSNAPLHIKQHFVHAHIDKTLKEKLNIKKRAIELRRGDTVKIMSGKYKGKTGKVLKVILKDAKVHIEGIVRKNSRGKEIPIPISASNLYIIDLDLTDKLRKEKLGLE